MRTSLGVITAVTALLTATLTSSTIVMVPFNRSRRLFVERNKDGGNYLIKDVTFINIIEEIFLTYGS